MKEVVFVIESGTPDKVAGFLQALSDFLADPAYKELRPSLPDVLDMATHLPDSESEEAVHELAAGVNWVLNCRVAPSQHDD